MTQPQALKFSGGWKGQSWKLTSVGQAQFPWWFASTPGKEPHLFSTSLQRLAWRGQITLAWLLDPLMLSTERYRQSQAFRVLWVQSLPGQEAEVQRKRKKKQQQQKKRLRCREKHPLTPGPACSDSRGGEGALWQQDAVNTEDIRGTPQPCLPAPPGPTHAFFRSDFSFLGATCTSGCLLAWFLLRNSTCWASCSMRRT